jgi:hypothetical protein
MADIDLDGDTDLFVANDGEANFLYRNDSIAGEGLAFVESGLPSGTRFNAEGRAEAGMGTDFGDLDADGWPDLVVANFSRETNTLYRNSGTAGGIFVDETARRGVGAPSFLPLGFGAALLDADGDGDLDLAVANGHVLDRVADIDNGLTWAQPDQLFVNDGAGRFADASSALATAFRLPRVSRGLAVGDYDNDGDEDLVITSNGAGPRLLQNLLDPPHWLILRLRSDGPGNRDGYGARVQIGRGDTILMRQVQSAGSYLAASDPRVTLALGHHQSASVTVHWPDGSARSWSLPAGDHTLSQRQ